MVHQQFNSLAVDNKKFDFFKQQSQQRFVKNETLIHQGINPDDRILAASRILAAGGSLFIEDQKRRHNTK